MERWTVTRVVATALFITSFMAIGILGSPGLDMTGYLTASQSTDVSVIGGENAELTRFLDNSPLIIGETLEIDVEAKNSGAETVTSQFTVEVYDANNTLLFTYPSDKRELAPGSFHSRIFRHTPHRTGTYIIRLEASVGSEEFQTARFINVNEEPEEPDPGPIIRRRKSLEYEYVDPPDPPEPEEDPEPKPDPDWDVSSQDNVSVGQGNSKLAAITVKNTGNVDLENIQLAVQNTENLTVKMNPKIMFNIQPNGTKYFMLDIQSPEHGQFDQTINYRIDSTTIEDPVQDELDVRVLPTLTLKQLEDQIDDLESVVDNAEAELKAEQERGVTSARSNRSLQDARSNLEAARTALEEKDISGARQSIDAVRNSIDRFYTAVFKARSDKVTVQPYLVQPSYLVIGLGMIVATLLVAVYHYLRKKHNRRPKLLREAE